MHILIYTYMLFQEGLADATHGCLHYTYILHTH